MNLNKLPLPEQLAEVMTRIYEAGLTTPSGGNLSARDKNGEFWLTPSGGDKGAYTKDDMICICGDKVVKGKGKPSIEWQIHKGILEKTENVKAVCHAHSPGLVGFSLLREAPDIMLMPQVADELGEVVIAQYGCPGTTTLRDNVLKALESNKRARAIILENHGAFVISEKGMQNAFGLFQDLEFCGKLQARASLFAQEKYNRLDEKILEKYIQARNDCLIKIQSQARYKGSQTEKPDSGESLSIENLKESVIKFMNRGYKRKLFTQNMGTIALRVSENSFLITTDESDNCSLSKTDIVLVKSSKDGETGKLQFEGEYEGKPHPSVFMAEQIFRENPDVEAIILSVPENAMIYSITDENFNLRTIPECYMVVKSEIEKFPAGSLYNMNSGLDKYIKERGQVGILRNEGFVSTGESLLQAFDRLEVLEASAKSVIEAGMMVAGSKNSGKEKAVINISEADAKEILDRYVY